METMNNKKISELVKDPRWQDLRKSLLGRWKKNPDWCLQELRNYLGPISKADDGKLIIVLNYLTGTAFRTGAISSRDNPKISELRGEISAELKKRKFQK